MLLRVITRILYILLSVNIKRFRITFVDIMITFDLFIYILRLARFFSPVLLLSSLTPRCGLTQHYVKKDQRATVIFCSKYPFSHTFPQQFYLLSQICMQEGASSCFCLQSGFFKNQCKLMTAITDMEHTKCKMKKKRPWFS